MSPLVPKPGSAQMGHVPNGSAHRWERGGRTEPYNQRASKASSSCDAARRGWEGFGPCLIFLGFVFSSFRSHRSAGL